MTQRSFIAKREQEWKELEKLLVTGNRGLREKAAWFPQAFRQLTGDLNTARSNGFDPALIERLNRLTLEGNQILYGREPFTLKLFSAFLFRTFPRSLRAQWRSFGTCFLIFFGLAVFTALVCIRFPGFIYEIVSPWEVSGIESMYDPDSKYYLQPREVSTDADMFGYYIYNNISIAFRTFASGLLAGVGSLFFLAFNGIFIGTVAGHIINCGFQETFFSFVAGHSAFELTAIVLSAQAGLLLGYSLFVTRGLSRSQALREAGKTALPIIAGSAIMLVFAAAIEAFWSSRHEIPPQIRIITGAAVSILVILYFVFAGREPRLPLKLESGNRL
ncbi:membrane protein [Spirochaetia bacterium]|nr:membrane protein [Spirochaetia bacterium]